MALPDEINGPATRPGPLRVGVTGNAGSGKSLVCRRFAALGAKIVSADVLARAALAPGSGGHAQVLKHFGVKALGPDGTLDRKALRLMILEDEAARRTLERIVHPEVVRRIREAIEDTDPAQNPMVVVEVPLLFEVGLEQIFDIVIVVRSPRESKLQRLIRRDGVSRREAENLLNLQMPDADNADRADFVIRNSGSRRRTIALVDQIFTELHQKCIRGTKTA
jgi:dephospho-CoA kinase